MNLRKKYEATKVKRGFPKPIYNEVLRQYKSIHDELEYIYFKEGYKIALTK